MQKDVPSRSSSTANLAKAAEADRKGLFSVSIAKDSAEILKTQRTSPNHPKIPLFQKRRRLGRLSEGAPVHHDE